MRQYGDFECLKAAVQNGADCVYFGASSFSARASATNFDLDELRDAIQYAKLRNVKTNLTLNTLIKNDEFDEALHVASKAYEYGIDAIIVQDLGLARFLIKNFPDLPIHASTQMTVHNLEGVKKLESLGFSRVVLSRELSANEITNICENSNVEIEAFVHGALCMSYSGRCLFSSMIGGRSGNRGRCAQPCRLPYELICNDNTMDKGYLLSPRDLCGLEYLPELVKAGVKCYKIEGRMKTPEYVATVTRIYRKYLDMIIKNEPYIISDSDKKDLMQVFNRGGFSTGHLDNKPNKELVYSAKPNHIGIPIGKIKRYIPGKSYIEIDLENSVAIGDSIMIDSEQNKYNVSELILGGKHIKTAENGTVLIGRLKGNIRIGDNVYKVFSKELSTNAINSFSKENIKIPLQAHITVKENEPISLKIESLADTNNIYHGLSLNLETDIIPEKAVNSPISVDRIIAQLNKTGNTEFEFKSISVDLDDGLYIPSISKLNELRRDALEKLEQKVISTFIRKPILYKTSNFKLGNKCENPSISLLLNEINENYNYSKLDKVENIYIPFKYFLNTQYSSIINSLHGNLYIYMPSIIRQNYKNLIIHNLPSILEKFNISGFVISNLADLELLPTDSKYKVIGNYTLNVFNNYTIHELKDLNIDKITLSPELSKIALTDSFPYTAELMVYGNTPVMTANYCLLGKANHCHSDCAGYCKTSKYYIKDRMGFKFRLVPDNIETVTTIYNSKTTSVVATDLGYSSYRIDILDENIDEINNIITSVRNGSRLEGEKFTNGNYNREV